MAGWILLNIAEDENLLERFHVEISEMVDEITSAELSDVSDDTQQTSGDTLSVKKSRPKKKSA